MKWRDGDVGVYWLGIGISLPAIKLGAPFLVPWLSWKMALAPIVSLVGVMLVLLVLVAFTKDEPDRRL